MQLPRAFLASALLAGPTFAQTTWYVDDDASGANDGTSWQDAFTELQDALAAADPLEEIWVATGTYRPSATGDRQASFVPEQQTMLFGGFDGTETAFEERAGLFDQTVLSGDLAGDDGPGFTNRADNSEHVFLMAVSIGTRIDGFTIRGGHATAIGGGAWYAEVLSCSRAKNCTFIDNEGPAGGAVWGSGYALDSFEDCRFLGNRANEGGAVRSVGGLTSLSFARCLFQGNVATTIGGGAISAGWIEVVSCVIIGNSADGTSHGGGAFLGGGWLQLSTVYANHSFGGAAVGGVAGCVQVLESILWGNADDQGTGPWSQYRNFFSGWGGIETSCVQGWIPALGGTQILSSDPEFIDPLGPDGIAGTPDDDLHLGALSPCVDRLSQLTWPLTDFDGARRHVDVRDCDVGITDLGAFERQTVDDAPSFCPATPSSLGHPATLRTPCSADIAAGRIELIARPVPAGNGLLLLGSARREVPFGNGVFCLGGDVYRLDPVPTVGDALLFDFDPALVFGGALVSGSTWNLQVLYFDSAAGGAGLNFTDAVALTLLP